MQGRTFLRIMLDSLFVNNPLCKAISCVVNFCNEQDIYNQKKLKFSKNMPLINNRKPTAYENRFIFANKYNSSTD